MHCIWQHGNFLVCLSSPRCHYRQPWCHQCRWVLFWRWQRAHFPTANGFLHTDFTLIATKDGFKSFLYRQTFKGIIHYETLFHETGCVQHVSKCIITKTVAWNMFFVVSWSWETFNLMKHVSSPDQRYPGNNYGMWYEKWLLNNVMDKWKCCWTNWFFWS